MKPYYEHAGITIYHGDCREILPGLPKSDLVRYCDDLAKKNSEALSFIPKPTIERYADSGQILAAFENGEPCGFLIFGNGWPVLRIYQACIQYDARKRASGRALVRKLLGIADNRRCGAISLWCASDLDSNGFWRECGFTFHGTRQGGARRGRTHNHWRMQISPTLFEVEIHEPYCEIAAKRLSQEVMQFDEASS